MRAAALLFVIVVLGCSSSSTGGPGAPVPDGGPRVSTDVGPPSDPDARPADPDPDPEPPEPDAGPEPEPEPPGPAPIAALDRLRMYLLIGDSMAAGYNASGRNDPGGHAFGRLLADDLSERFGTVDFRRVAESGATSGDALANLRDALGGSLPRTLDGDVLVHINVGGNDFNDRVTTILGSAETMRAAATLRANLAEMFRLLRERYEDAAAGKAVVFLVDDVYDPSDGTGEVPREYDDGFCGTFHSPLLTPELRRQGVANLAAFNRELAAEVAAQRGELVGIHARFLGHGMNGGSERWIDRDCAHPTDTGHDAIRDLAWEVLE